MVADQIARDLAGLDALETGAPAPGRGTRILASAWPKLLALGLALLGWQIVVATGWRPEYLLPGPASVARALAHDAATAHFWQALGTTLRRAATGFALASLVGLVVGLVVARNRPLRAAVGSLITALQTMPSIAWFPLAILLYQLTENAILFVVVLGAAPAVANGVLTGVDYVPPLLVRAGRNIGARGFGMYRHVVGPAALPAVVAGLKQGWAFAWRSLMAGELLVVIADRPALGADLQFARDTIDAPAMVGTMIVILAVGLVVDAVFGAADASLRRRRGLTTAT